MLPRLAAILLIGSLVASAGDEPSAEEYHVKGAFLLNFAKFVEWPAQSFKSPADPIVLCIVGKNPFGPGFSKAAQQMTIGGRSIAVRETSNVQEASQCQIVFLAESEHKLARRLIEALQNESVLTVGESDGFTSSGGIIGFRLEGDKVRFEISPAAAEKAKLRISSKLLSMGLPSKG